MSTKNNSPAGRVTILVCVLIAIATAMVTTVGIALRGTEEAVAVVSPRGETYLMVTDGIYRFNSQRMVAEGVGWDMVTLALVVPALLVALPALRKGILKARLFVVGLLMYLFYQYLMYSTAWAFSVLFVPFVAIYSASLFTVVRLMWGISLDDLADRCADTFPRRGMAIFSALIGLLLIGMWIGLIRQGLTAGIDGVLLGQTTLVVQGLDLGLVVPVAFWAAGALWGRRPVGYVLGLILAIKGTAMASAITAMLVSAWAVEGTPEIGSLLIFATATVAAGYLALKMFRSLGTEASH